MHLNLIECVNKKLVRFVCNACTIVFLGAILSCLVSYSEQKSFVTNHSH
jgi:hypothetical protein